MPKKSEDPVPSSRRRRRGALFTGSYSEELSPARKRSKKVGSSSSKQQKERQKTTTTGRRKKNATPTPAPTPVDYERPRWNPIGSRSAPATASCAADSELVAVSLSAPPSIVLKAAERFCDLAREAFASMDWSFEDEDDEEEENVEALTRLLEQQTQAEDEARKTLQRLIDHEAAWRRAVPARLPSSRVAATAGGESDSSLREDDAPNIGDVAATAKADVTRALDAKVVKVARLADQARRVDRALVDASAAQRILYDAFEQTRHHRNAQDPKNLIRTFVPS